MPQTNYTSGTSSSGSQNAVVASPGGLSQALVGCLFVGTAQAVTSGTTASSWVPTGRGPNGTATPTLPANFLVPGKTIRLRVMGSLTTAATPGTVTFGFAVGSSTLWTSGAVTPGASSTFNFILDIAVTCLTAGASGTCSLSGQLSYGSGGATAVEQLVSASVFGSAINTTLSNLLAVTTTNSVSGGSVFTVNTFMVEVLN
jgi:hypothetical protein